MTYLGAFLIMNAIAIAVITVLATIIVFASTAFAAHSDRKNSRRLFPKLSRRRAATTGTVWTPVSGGGANKEINND